jgi:glycosyltransferase involved in cell wall biosynthesis
MDSPLVSIITPTLNSDRFLKQCIESVLSQTYENIEHIFIDGCSTDKTLQILENYNLHYPDRIKYFSGKDKNVADAWNKGLDKANGQILGWLGADDLYREDAVSTVVDFFNNNLEAMFVYGECFCINDNGNVISRFLTKEFDYKEAINDACYISCTSAFYKRELVYRIGLMDITIPNTNDAEYWIRAGKYVKPHHLDKVLSYFRVREGSLSGSRNAEKLQALEGYIINRRYKGNLLSPRVARYLVYKYGEWMIPLVKPIWRKLRDEY